MTRNVPHAPQRSEAGVVYVEFLLAFMPVFILFVGMVQLALLQAGRLIVQETAREAARAAAVILPDDPARYDGAPEGELMPEEPAAQASEEPEQTRQNLASQLGVPDIDLPDPPWDPPAPGPRMAAVQRGVYFRLSTLAPTAQQLFSLWDHKRTVAAALDDGVFTRALVGTLFYGAAVTAISFPVEPGSMEVYERVVDAGVDLLHVRVTYLFRCAVPIASAIMCDRLSDLGIDWLQKDIEAPDGDPLLQGDLERIPSRTGLRLLASTPQRFFVLREEASFPYQDADYTYPEPAPEEE